jgi:hypothetical protein
MSNPTWGEPIVGGYFDEEKHLYRNNKGVIVPSSTQVFSILGLSDFSMIDPQTLEWKRHYGDAVHAATEFMVTDDLDWESLDPHIEAPVRGIQKRLQELQFELAATEERRVASIFGMEYGMTLDLSGTIMHQGIRRKAVLDLKTGTKREKYWDWQLGSYLWPQEKSVPGWIGVVLQVDPNGAITPHYVADVEAAKREFQCLLASTILLLNNKYAKLG